MTTTATELPTQLAAEIAALPAFTSYGNAVAVISPIRARYISRLNGAWLADKLSDQLVHAIGEQLQRQCDRAIALNARIVDANHGPPPGWASVPIDCLSQTEKENLT